MLRNIKLCKIIITVFTLVLLILLSVSCFVQPHIKTELHELVYRRRRQDPDEYTVYISENGTFEPYFVIDGNYDGGVLLLRKHVTEERMMFGGVDGYYPESLIDKYLNTEFIANLPVSVQETILISEILVATTDAYKKRETEEIARRIFLLSATELNRRRTSTLAVEGEALIYFKHGNPRYGTLRNGINGASWLRSTYFSQAARSMAWATFPNQTGLASYEATSVELSLRPAFCLPPDTLIGEMFIDEKLVYIVLHKEVYQ